MEQQRRTEDKVNDQQQSLPPTRRMKPPENQMAAPQNHQQPPPPPPPQKCPRCDSSNTKFCYYNNYSLTQPRYFCKACRRYWTQGGTLRNVPVGGGCRKTKRPKPSSSSTSNEVAARTQSLQPQNLAGMVPGHGLRASPSLIPSMGNSFYTTGAFMSPLPAGINQGAAVNFNGGNSQFGANMALLQGMNLRPPGPPQQFQAQNDFFRSQQSLIPQRPLNSWTQSFINRSTAGTSAGSPTFWSGAIVCNTVDGENQAGSSFNPNQWSTDNNNPGFGPSQ
ncbi:hypothetical protein BUALT_Bualt03G0055200 [Buddleja alternifolia]|uniref:Dof zinc finger protein n=1 Tax=Buddleja alternifolia TaxID=168488 RepID=A0AAV6XYQ4_9LAMI|nr:hypothetical protein BUALT_Bualt03G0055200 [Buddleja alternifolia]